MKTWRVIERWTEPRFVVKDYVAETAGDAMKMAVDDGAFYDYADYDESRAMNKHEWTVTEKEQ